jgi:ribonuclease R
MSEKDSPFSGEISVSRKGIGYIEIPGTDDDAEIAPEHIGGAFHKDTVTVELLKKKPGDKRQPAKVISVDNRFRTSFVGELYEDNNDLLVRADDRRVYVPFHVGKVSDNRDFTIGHKVLVEMEPWDGKGEPSVKILEVIGKAGLHETEMRAFVLAKGFELGFPLDVEQEAEKIDGSRTELFDEAEQQIKNGTRRDFRGILTFTIDPADAKDFDDAISFKELGGGRYEVGIHIADVSFYVRPGTAIDTEARKRATSIYLVDRTIPMLPEVLSNELCSLMPDVDRLATSAVFEIDDEGHVHKSWYGQAMIRSTKRFTYEEAQESIVDNTKYLHRELALLNTIAKKMRAVRASHGAISFEQDEVKFKLDETGKPIGVYKKKRQDSNMLIEDYMLLANREVARHVTEVLEKEKKTKNGNGKELFIYRIHDAPDPERIEALSNFVHALGYSLEAHKGVVTAKSITKLFKELEGKPEEDLVKTATIRSLAKAIYSIENIGHFGLAFTYYTHFTSPIRRYPDVMVHRILKSYAIGPRLSVGEYKAYERLVVSSTEREIAAAEAERDSIKYKQVEYMMQFIGKDFDGVISGVSEAGVFVEETETKAEGLVRMRDLGTDFFMLDRDHYRVVGERTKKMFRLGDKVRFKLMKADLAERVLDFAFISP